MEGPHLDTYVVVLERTARQTARVELQALSYADAEKGAILLALHDEAITWDSIGVDRPHILHIDRWHTRIPPE